jgi:DNA-binding protein H-NS
MSKTYAQVMKQIDSLKSEAEKLRRKEIEGVVGRIREAITHYGLTAADLGLPGAPSAKASAPTGKKRRSTGKGAAPQAPRFRDEAGHIWGGRGPRPKWLRDALTAGRKLEEFAVK